MATPAVSSETELRAHPTPKAYPSIPARHGANLQKTREIARPLLRLIRGNPEPTAEQWQALGEALLRGDPPADRLVAWMQASDTKTRRGLFERALEHGIESIASPPAALRELFAIVDAKPTWFDEELAEEGARVCSLSGLTGLRVLRDVALMGGYQASAINQTLIATGALLGKNVQRRLAETTKWWLDCSARNGMKRHSLGFTSTVRVRVVHALVRRSVEERPDWDSATWGLPVNQVDMAATYLGFSVIFLFGQRLLGVPLTDQEGHAVMHLWRYIGWLMGVEEQFLCETEMQGRIQLYQNVLCQAPPDESSKLLGRALMDEPLLRHYPHFTRLRGKYERARHLAICRIFLGRQGMRDLGLPAVVVPWYPLVSAPLIAASHMLHRALPGGHARLVEQGRRAQLDHLRILFGKAKPDIAHAHSS